MHKYKKYLTTLDYLLSKISSKIDIFHLDQPTTNNVGLDHGAPSPFSDGAAWPAGEGSVDGGRVGRQWLTGTETGVTKATATATVTVAAAGNSGDSNNQQNAVAVAGGGNGSEGRRR